ncbi:site-specific integrase [Herbaspirillum huttiense]|uniref:site-specific integrase n=1 Tax=Herbaspirillum huttiense TaxID=863372 RepID=UPI0035C6986D
MERYSASPNTCRAYQRELDRLQAWLLTQKLSFELVGRSHLEAYPSWSYPARPHTPR